jgi:adenylate cyclase class IV
MSYVVTFYGKCSVPCQQFYKTKREALKRVREDVKSMVNIYKNTGYKKKGSLKKCRIYFEHERHGVDYMWIVENNNC